MSARLPPRGRGDEYCHCTRALCLGSSQRPASRRTGRLHPDRLWQWRAARSQWTQGRRTQGLTWRRVALRLGCASLRFVPISCALWCRYGVACVVTIPPCVQRQRPVGVGQLFAGEAVARLSRACHPLNTSRKGIKSTAREAKQPAAQCSRRKCTWRMGAWVRMVWASRPAVSLA